MRRIWTEVEVVPHAAGYAILLDGKPPRLLGIDGLAVRQEALAHAIAEEWRSARPVFSPDSLTLTQLALAAQGPASMLGLRDRLAAFGASDVLCYRDAQDEDLAAHEAMLWDPWLDWATAALGATMQTGLGVAPVTQSPAALAALRKALTERTAFEMAALQLIVPALGSLILGLAIIHDALTPQAACQLAEAEAIWQEARWGADPATAELRAAKYKDVAAGAHFVKLCRA